MNTIYNFQAIVPELKKSLRLSLPLMGSQLFYASNGIITTMMLAHLGHKELATNALAWSIYIIDSDLFWYIKCCKYISFSQP
jgi:Na+-driven multidrug efflux pump